ncbi:MAG TPA: hypothetical protein VGR11_04600 [Solirubrobacteraceae bacterium]|nr:hypothetical protein [Solirubrobacteraceae bacterium]
MSNRETAPPADQGLLSVRPDPPPEQRLRRFLRWLGDGYREEPAPSRLGVLEDFDPERIGICCSGGGIRSASFNLGALQALRHEQELGKAKYLAAVSGGSYIAGSVCMVAKTWPAGEERPPPGEPGHDDSDPSIVNRDALPFHPQSPEEQYLRNRSTYMAPTRPDKLFLAWRVLLGLVVNLTLVGLPLFAIGTALAIVLYRPDYGELTGATGPFSAEAPEWAWWTLGALAAAAVALGLTSLLSRPKPDWVRRFLETWSLRMLLLSAAAALLLVAIPEIIALLQTGLEPHEDAEVGVPAGIGVGSIGSLLLAALLELRSREAHPSAVAQVGRARAALRRASPRIRRAFVYVVTFIAGPLLLLGIVVLAATVALANSTPTSVSTPTWLWGLIVPLAVFALLYVVSDLNTWSLHPFYRRRLCSAFALKRIYDENAPEGAPRQKAVERDYNALVPLSESGVWPGPATGGWPTLLVCAAVNVSDPGATPPGRGVSSFTFSRDAMGGPLVGAIPTKEYERRLGANRLRDITLPAAIAMSGAAISPSMGKATNVPLRMLMALANVRLGVWVPNPRYVSSDDWTQRTRRKSAQGPRESGIEKVAGRPNDVIKHPRLSYLFRELVGRNRVDGRFLYITDGGHYENLGLVELLRRGCGKIYCFDASGGKPAAALGDAIALARSELGVEVVINPTHIKLDEDGFAEDSCAVGIIKHRGAVVGRLVYAPTVLTPGMPWDVRAYKEADPVFPHHSTGDQLYTDQRFEAYRALGEHAGERARQAMRTGSADAAAPPSS